MGHLLTFNDANIIPKFSDVPNKESIDLSVNKTGYPYYTLPIISAPHITGPDMARAMLASGGGACLKSPTSIDEHLKMFIESKTGGYGAYRLPTVTTGIGLKEIERAEALADAGAISFFIDVDHGASIEVVKHVAMLREILGQDFSLTVGNFQTGLSVEAFLEKSRRNAINGIKVGSGYDDYYCGVSIPQLSALMDCKLAIKKAGLTMISEGGITKTTDIIKAIGAGADMVITSRFLQETSASLDSSCDFLVHNVMKAFENQLREGLFRVGAFTINEFHSLCEFVRICSYSNR